LGEGREGKGERGGRRFIGCGRYDFSGRCCEISGNYVVVQTKERGRVGGRRRMGTFHKTEKHVEIGKESSLEKIR